MFSLFPHYYGQPQTVSRGAAGFLTSTILHAVVGLAVIFGFVHRDEIEALAKPIAVSLIEAGQPKPAKPLPPPQIKAPKPILPLPVATSIATEGSSAPSGVMAAPTSAAVNPGPAMTEARFDADYLSNPKPIYPTASRRLGEAGTVYLRVHVSAEGHALHVELKKSSGYERLDQSAQSTVSQWKFVPARRGGAAVTSWVVVPIIFSLT